MASLKKKKKKPCDSVNIFKVLNNKNFASAERLFVWISSILQISTSQLFVELFLAEREQRSEEALWQASERRTSLGSRSPGNQLYTVTTRQYAGGRGNEYHKSNFPSDILPLEIHHCRLHWLKAVVKLLLQTGLCKVCRGNLCLMKMWPTGKHAHHSPGNPPLFQPAQPASHSHWDGPPGLPVPL